MNQILIQHNIAGAGIERSGRCFATLGLDVIHLDSTRMLVLTLTLVSQSMSPVQVRCDQCTRSHPRQNSCQRSCHDAFFKHYVTASL